MPRSTSADLQYQIFYLFPLTREEQTIALVERTMLVAGAGLVLLLAGIAALVTRQVVRPVRQAAATAERLAAGRLKERMSVRGEDDLATLAASFNRMADTVQRQISQLRELSRVQRRFVADVSHELRTPITTIRMAADLLHDAMADLPPELARSTELLQLQLDRFELLLADLLEISRHDAGAAVLEAEPTDLGRLVTAVVATATPLAVRRGSQLTADIPAAPVDRRRGLAADRPRAPQPRRERRGACRRRPGRRHARHRDDGGRRSSVRDYGIGLKPGEASLVFGRFWRADPARTRTTGGTGLGLSIALEDTRLHGGWLQAWGEPGRGSVFRLTLPVADRRRHRRRAAAARPRRRDGRGAARPGVVADRPRELAGRLRRSSALLIGGAGVRRAPASPPQGRSTWAAPSRRPAGPSQDGIRVLPAPPQPGMSQVVARRRLPARDGRRGRQLQRCPRVPGARGRPGTPRRERTLYNQAGLLLTRSRVDRGRDAGPCRRDALEPRRLHLAARANLVRRFTMVRQAGQWRISRPPPGVLLATVDAQRSLELESVYYLNSSGTALVPDQILRAAPEQPGTATTLMRALLSGPPAPLSSAVTTALPAGTRLLGNVPVGQQRRRRGRPVGPVASDLVRRRCAGCRPRSSGP